MGWEMFGLHIWFKVGIENRIHFWHDLWCGDQSLKEAFPLLYENSIDWDASMGSLLVRQVGGEGWFWGVWFSQESGL